MKKLYLAVILLIACGALGAQPILSVGPMVHVNIDGEGYKVSYGLEFAYWNIENFPYSFDFGIEGQKGAFRIYSEAQTGIGFGGISLGPCLEFADKTRLQLQGSVWVNYILGGDLRFRSGEHGVFAPGMYLKFPWVPGKESNSSGSSDFDFD